MSETEEKPWALAERFDLAVRLARAECSVDQIVKSTGLSEATAKSIRQRECPDFVDFSGLRKFVKEDEA